MDWSGVDYCDVFISRLSFWRHPFTAEDHWWSSDECLLSLNLFWLKTPCFYFIVTDFDIYEQFLSERDSAPFIFSVLKRTETQQLEQALNF